MKLPRPHPDVIQQFCYGPKLSDGVPVYWLDRTTGRRSDVVIWCSNERTAQAVAHMLQTMVNFNPSVGVMSPMLTIITDLFRRFEPL